MKWDTALRGIGVIAILCAYYVFAMYGDRVYPLAIAVVGVIALVSPEVLDRLPFGPNR